MAPRLFSSELRELAGLLLEDIDKEWYGIPLMEETGIASGTLYPMLHRLHKDGWLTQRIDQGVHGSPRKYYKLTDLGVREMTKRLG